MKKGVTFQTENGVYSLRFSINNLCKLEDLLGRPLAELGTNVGLREMRTMFYCGLTPSVSLEECGDIMGEVIEEKGVEELNSLLAKALNLGMGGDILNSPEMNKKKV